MRRVELEQGSKEWLDWRKERLTATDAAALLGVSPYVTPFKCWERKVGQAPEQVVTSAMLRGLRDEPRARKMFIDMYGINMTPCCIESAEYDFLGASLDGISDCGRYILEVKSQQLLPIKTFGVPEFHMPQMQHQMMCDKKIEKCFYVSIWENEIVVIEVLPDLNWRKEYLPKAIDFWKGVLLFDPPSLSNRDYVDMSGKGQWNTLAREYREINEQIKSLEDQRCSLKKQLITICGENSCTGYGIKVLKKTIKGRIDYDKAFEAFQIEEGRLAEFRKPSSSSWMITID